MTKHLPIPSQDAPSNANTNVQTKYLDIAYPQPRSQTLDLSHFARYKSHFVGEAQFSHKTKLGVATGEFLWEEEEKEGAKEESKVYDEALPAQGESWIDGTHRTHARG
jgi:hypothetical protein